MTDLLRGLPGDPTPAVTVIGTNLVIDYGDPEAARDAMARLERHHTAILAHAAAPATELVEAAQAVVDAWEANDLSLGWDGSSDLVDALRATLEANHE